MTESESKKLTAILAAMFDVPAWSPERLRGFAASIADLDFAPAEAAVKTWISTRAERPSVADIRDATRKQLDAAGATPHEVEPDEAWGYVVRCMSEVGSYRPFPTDRYPEVAAIVERMSWETLCRSDNPEADRAHFLRLFEIERKRVREARNSAPALRLPADGERLELQQRATTGQLDHRPAPLRLPAPTPDQRADGARAISGIIADLSRGPTRVPAVEVEPQIETPREPTDAELAAAAARRAELLAQLDKAA